MKPFKSGKPIASWLLRIAIIPVIFSIYYNPVSTLNLGNFSYYIGVVMLISSFFIVLGGILSKPEFTIISGLIIALISFYKMIISFNGIFDIAINQHFIIFSIGFYFFSNGNEN